MTDKARAITAPAGLADALAAAVGERGAGFYGRNTAAALMATAYNVGRLDCLHYLRSIEAAPLTCTLADAKAETLACMMLLDRWREWADNADRTPQPLIADTYKLLADLRDKGEGEAGAEREPYCAMCNSTGVAETSQFGGYPCPECRRREEAGAEPLAVGDRVEVPQVDNIAPPGGTPGTVVEINDGETFVQVDGFEGARYYPANQLRKLPAAEQPADAPSVAELGGADGLVNQVEAIGMALGGVIFNTKDGEVTAASCPRLDELAEAVRTLQQDVAALKQQGGEHRAAYMQGVRDGMAVVAKADGRERRARKRECIELPQPPAPEGK